MATVVSIALPGISVAAETAFTVAALRRYVTSDLSDADLQPLLDAAKADVDQAAGPIAARERRRARGELLMLTQRAASITTIVEDARGAAVTLAADDWELSGTGLVLWRLRSGTNPSGYWRGLVDVRYQRPDDTAARIRVMVALVQLDLTHKPGLSGQKIGTWEESYTSNSAFNYQIERAAILASLTDADGGIR